MNLRQLEVFRAIMQTGSVTEAARLLNVSQPTVSVILKHAEARIGLKLFERIGNRLHPTPEASDLFPTVESVFARVDFLEQNLKNLKDGTSGMLQVGAIPSLTQSVFLPALRYFCRAHPRVHVTVWGFPTPETIAAVANHRTEIGLAYSPGEGEMVEVEPFRKTEICCVMRADHPLARKEVVDFADLRDECIIANVVGSPLRRRIEAALHTAGASCDVRIEAGTLETYDLSHHGIGVGLVDIAPFPRDRYPDLVCRPLTPPILAQSYLIFPAKRPRSIMARRFVEILRCLFDGLSADTIPWLDSDIRSELSAARQEPAMHCRGLSAPPGRVAPPNH